MPISNMRRPDESAPPPPIPEGFDETKTYRVQLTDIEERESQYANQKTGKKDNYLSWHVTPYDEDGVAFIDERTGGPLDVYVSSPMATFYNPETREKAKAREFADAFCDRDLTDDEISDMIDAGWVEPLRDKWALASFEVKTNDKGYENLRVIKLRGLSSAKRSRMRQSDAVPPRQPASAAPPQRSRPPRLDEEE